MLMSVVQVHLSPPGILKSPRAHRFWGFVNLAFSFSLVIQLRYSASSIHSLWTHTMNRCTPRLPHLSHYLIAALLLAAASQPALAQSEAGDTLPGRQFPKAVLRGELVVLTPPEITLDGKPERLSPGARIRGADNLLVMSGALVNQKLAVNYVREPAGQVHQVWILTEDEAKLGQRSLLQRLFNWGSAPADGAKTP
jgi:hypothetical protein